MKKLTIYVAIVVVALSVAASALAGSSDEPYAGKAAGVQTTVTKAAKADTKASTAGTLPFTGLDLSLIVAGGAVLLLVGAGLRRAGRNKA